MRTPAVILFAALLLGGCEESFEKPTEVRVARTINRDGSRVISYTAMYDDGIETYIRRGKAFRTELRRID